jgi:hypothetical protein
MGDKDRGHGRFRKFTAFVDRVFRNNHSELAHQELIAGQNFLLGVSASDTSADQYLKLVTVF